MDAGWTETPYALLQTSMYKGPSLRGRLHLPSVPWDDNGDIVRHLTEWGPKVLLRATVNKVHRGAAEEG